MVPLLHCATVCAGILCSKATSERYIQSCTYMPLAVTSEQTPTTRNKQGLPRLKLCSLFPSSYRYTWYMVVVRRPSKYFAKQTLECVYERKKNRRVRTSSIKLRENFLRRAGRKMLLVLGPGIPVKYSPRIINTSYFPPHSCVWTLSSDSRRGLMMFSHQLVAKIESVVTGQAPRTANI